MKRSGIVIVALMVFAASARGQNITCPRDTTLRGAVSEATVTLVGRIVTIIVDSNAPRRANDSRPVLSRNAVLLEYEILATLRGDRGDNNRNFIAPLPGHPWALSWHMDSLYLLVLTTNASQRVPGARPGFWTASCWHTRGVASVAIAQQLLSSDSTR